MDGDLMAIRHYDFKIDKFREMTQEDWDALIAGANRVHRECIALQAELRERGLPLPKGIKDRSSMDDLRELERFPLC
jgi:hypothetical protein